MIKTRYMFMLVIGLSMLSGSISSMLFSYYTNMNLKTVEVAPQTIEQQLNIKPNSNNVPCVNCVYITHSNTINAQASPILTGTLYTNKEIKDYKLSLISGRSYTQNLDRNISGNKSPLPKGNYIIKKETKGLSPETGGVFLPITPTFNTERSHIGFHVDPSWGLNNNENGTEGCLAFKTIQEYNEFVKMVKDYNITNVVVDF
jgi:hypothetical protein